MDLHQVFLMTRDLETAAAFYRDLGFAVHDRGSRSVEFDTGATTLKIEADFDAETLSGFGLSLPGGNRGDGAIVVVAVDDVDSIADAATRAAEEHGGEVLFGPRDVAWGRRLLLVRDPDGYVIELSEPA